MPEQPKPHYTTDWEEAPVVAALNRQMRAQKIFSRQPGTCTSDSKSKDPQERQAMYPALCNTMIFLMSRLQRPDPHHLRRIAVNGLPACFRYQP